MQLCRHGNPAAARRLARRAISPHKRPKTLAVLVLGGRQFRRSTLPEWIGKLVSHARGQGVFIEPKHVDNVLSRETAGGEPAYPSGDTLIRSRVTAIVGTLALEAHGSDPETSVLNVTSGVPQVVQVVVRVPVHGALGGMA